MHHADLAVLEELPDPELLRGPRDGPSQGAEEEGAGSNCLPRGAAEGDPGPDLRGSQPDPQSRPSPRGRLPADDRLQVGLLTVLPTGQTQGQQS